MTTKPIVTQMDALLGALGFTRQKMTWNRKVSPLGDVVDIELSKTDDAVTVNAGVLHPVAHAICWGTEPPFLVEEPSCTVRARIGQLIDGKDRWWREVSDGIAEEIAALVRAYVLPFLDRMYSERAMAAQLASLGVTKQKYPPPIIYLAVLKWENGEVVEAKNLLDDLRKHTVGAWQAKVSEAIERLGRSGPTP